MSLISKTIQSGDWKNEKHVPTIQVEKGDGDLRITVDIGHEDPHPNLLEHHIQWIKVFFQPDGFKFPIEVGSYEFTAHGEEDLFSHPEVTAVLKTDKPGTVHAISYCNIHGLWENSEEVK